MDNTVGGLWYVFEGQFKGEKEMTKQAIIGLIAIIIWFILGALSIVSVPTFIAGIIGLFMGFKLSQWENEEIKGGLKKE